jgi:hypothetical protein
MRLFSVIAKLLNVFIPIETIIPAFDKTTATKKLKYLINNNRLNITTHKYDNDGNPITAKHTIDGLVETAEVEEIHHKAFPNRVWNEQDQRFNHPAPRYNGRSLAPINQNPLPTYSEFAKGWIAASNLFTKSKKLDAQLKKLNESPSFKTGFAKQWNRLANGMPNNAKKIAPKTRKTTKTTKTSMKLAEAV